MQNNQSVPQDDWRATTAQGLNLVYFVSNVFATSIGVFIRKDFGKEALGFNSLFAFIAMVLIAGDSPDKAFGYFVIAFVGMQIYRRIETFRLCRKGDVIHSQYAGYPYLAMKVPFVKSEKVAREVVEPVICVIAGLLLMPVSVGMGDYILICAIGLVVRHCMEDAVSRRRVQRMRDAQIEHEWYSDKMRG